jgi:hypothetical protein
MPLFLFYGRVMNKIKTFYVFYWYNQLHVSTNKLTIIGL